MTKRIVIIQPDGTETVLDHKPNLAEMQKIVGGWIERARVLSHIHASGRYIYTYMIVNEEGLLQHLPRNPKATALYQRNVREQFKGEKDPFAAADAAFNRRAKAMGATVIVIEGTPADAIAQGYKFDPWIVGTVIHFEGYTTDELDQEDE